MAGVPQNVDGVAALYPLGHDVANHETEEGCESLRLHWVSLHLPVVVAPELANLHRADIVFKPQPGSICNLRWALKLGMHMHVLRLTQKKGAGECHKLSSNPLRRRFQ